MLKSRVEKSSGYSLGLKCPTTVKKMPELGEPGKAVDLWFLGVHPDYRGNKIANFLTKG